jgi:hypothetical protein
MDKIKLINRVTSDPKDRALLRAAMFDSEPAADSEPAVEPVKKKVSKKRAGK